MNEIEKIQQEVHEINSDWQEIGSTLYNVAAPSGRIWHAIDAMRLMERRRGMRIDMFQFRDKQKRLCFMCCGGASRAVIEGWDTPETFVDQYMLHNSGANVNDYERSLDYFRSGLTAAAFEHMGLPRGNGEGFNRDIPNFEDDKRAFYSELDRLANDLDAAGW